MRFLIIQEAFPYKVVKRYKTLNSVNKFLNTEITQKRIEAMQKDTFIGSSKILCNANGFKVQIL